MKRNLGGICVLQLLAIMMIAGCNKDSGSDSFLLGLLGGGDKKLVLTTFQAAGLVLGQPNLTTGTAKTAAQNTFSNNTWSQPSVINGKLYLPDHLWNRIMVYNSFPTDNFQFADAVLGQANFTAIDYNSGGAAGQNTTLKAPECVSSDGTRFLIVDSENNRVLLYDSVPNAPDAQASLVVGQPDFTTVTPDTSASKFSLPESAIFAGGKLIVADSSNNRVLIFNSLPAENGTTASIVLGQGDFDNDTENDDDQNGIADATPSARTFHWPVSVWSDGTSLIVCDLTNNRILIWNSFPTMNFQPSDLVVGQANMSDTSSSGGAAGLNGPYFITVHHGQLIVADYFNNRVLIFSSLPTANGASAEIVLGQSDFVHNTRNDDDQNGTVDAVPSARTLYYPAGVCVINGKLIVSDKGNSRFLVYESQ